MVTEFTELTTNPGSEGAIAVLDSDNVTAILQRLLDQWGVSNYGRVEFVMCDSEEKRLCASLALKGEAAPIEITVDYSIGNLGGVSVFNADNVVFSREWMTMLFDGFCTPENRRIELQSGAAEFLSYFD